MPYKVVYGSCAMGFKDVAYFDSYEDCVRYLSNHTEQIASDNEDPHYTESLDIMNAQTGRLMSWVLRAR